MRDDLQFSALAIIALALIVGEIVLSVTDSSPVELHAALLVVIAGLLGYAGTPPKKP